MRTLSLLVLVLLSSCVDKPPSFEMLALENATAHLEETLNDPASLEVSEFSIIDTVYVVDRLNDELVLEKESLERAPGRIEGYEAVISRYEDYNKEGLVLFIDEIREAEEAIEYLEGSQERYDQLVQKIKATPVDSIEAIRAICNYRAANLMGGQQLYKKFAYFKESGDLRYISSR